MTPHQTILLIAVTASAGYILLGGLAFLYVPPWAMILFYPGFSAGELAYGLLGIISTRRFNQEPPATRNEPTNR